MTIVVVVHIIVMTNIDAYSFIVMMHIMMHIIVVMHIIVYDEY